MINDILEQNTAAIKEAEARILARAQAEIAELQADHEKVVASVANTKLAREAKAAADRRAAEKAAAQNRLVSYVATQERTAQAVKNSLDESVQAANAAYQTLLRFGNDQKALPKRATDWIENFVAGLKAHRAAFDTDGEFIEFCRLQVNDLTATMNWQLADVPFDLCRALGISNAGWFGKFTGDLRLSAIKAGLNKPAPALPDPEAIQSVVEFGAAAAASVLPDPEPEPIQAGSVLPDRVAKMPTRPIASVRKSLAKNGKKPAKQPATRKK